MRHFLIILMALLLNINAIAAADDARKRYIDTWSKTAMEQMVLHKIPASITLAQGILESRNGESDLTVRSNNHFGIKCHSSWTGKKVYADDDKKNECFRKYKNADQSFEDHSQFLLRKRYESLFQLKPNDYKGWARGLKKCGYATDPKYANLLIKLIEENDLTKYDKLVLSGKFETGESEMIADNPKEIKKKATKPKVIKESDEFVVDLVKAYNVKKHSNNIKYIVAHGGETVDQVAEKLELGDWQLNKYNDLEGRKKLKEGEVVFIQPKRNSSKTDVHTVKVGDTLRSISQKYGVKIKKLEQYNSVTRGSKLQVGSKIKLRKSKT